MKSKKLTNNLVMLAMLILPFSVLADVMPPPSMTTKDEGILFYEGIRKDFLKRRLRQGLA